MLRNVSREVVKQLLSFRTSIGPTSNMSALRRVGMLQLSSNRDSGLYA